jgi:hypothetical protein
MVKFLFFITFLILILNKIVVFSSDSESVRVELKTEKINNIKVNLKKSVEEIKKQSFKKRDSLNIKEIEKEYNNQNEKIRNQLNDLLKKI